MSSGDVKTREELIAAFADNNSGGITAQNLRDFLASLTLTAESINVLSLKGVTSDGSPTDGQIWYRSDTKEFRLRINSTTYKLTVAPV